MLRRVRQEPSEHGSSSNRAARAGYRAASGGAGDLNDLSSPVSTVDSTIRTAINSKEKLMSSIAALLAGLDSPHPVFTDAPGKGMNESKLISEYRTMKQSEER
jgi:hypothetical protein